VGVAVVGVLVGAIVGDAVGSVGREKHRVSTCLVQARKVGPNGRQWLIT